MKLSAFSLCLAVGLTSITGSRAVKKTSRNLQVLDKNPVECNPENPCDECQGDCDTNDDCVGDLVCYQKDKTTNAERAIVPGCDGLDYSATDYCVVDEAAMVDSSDGIVPGFYEGMAANIAGLWVGEERYNDNGVVLEYCSKALFQTSENGNYLTWHGYYLGENNETCADMGVDPKTGDVNSTDYFTDKFYPEESYVLRVDYKACLLETDCSYDLTTSDEYSDYEVIASACGAHLKEDLLQAYFSCELYQINTIQKKDGTEDPMDVVILTYSSFEGGYENLSCPNKPTFDEDEFLSDPIAEGMTRFIKQSSYEGNSTDFECLV